MANTGQPNSGGSQYFITVVPFTNGNNTYSAFGHITLGSEIVEEISEVPTDANDKPLIDVVIDSIRIMTPQLDDFLPEEDTLYINAGEPIGFALICNDEGVTYSWYVDDELQQATGFSFDLTLTVNDWHEVKGVVSNDNYDLPKLWWIFITGGSGINNDVVSNRTVLYQNIPNPFNPETNIKFYLKDAGFVSLEVFNLKGQFIKTLVNSDLPVGEYSFIWNGKDQNGNQVASGIYLYNLRTKNISEKKKAILLK